MNQTDLVKRLRAGTGGGKHWMDLHTEAADAIDLAATRQFNPLAGTDGQMLIVAALRYALGRSSYMPGCIIDWIDKNTDLIDENTTHTILRDVVQWLADFSRREDEDALPCGDEWTRFALRHLARFPQPFRQRVVRRALYMPELREATAAHPFMAFWGDSR